MWVVYESDELPNDNQKDELVANRRCQFGPNIQENYGIRSKVFALIVFILNGAEKHGWYKELEVDWVAQKQQK